MRFLFVFPHSQAYSGETVRQGPSGGTEKAVIYLSEALERAGHEVIRWTCLEEIRSGRVLMPDVVIAQEAQYLEAFSGAQKVWWCHHFADQPIIQRSAGFARAFADKVVTLSACQQEDFKRNLRIDSVVIPHGVWFDEIAKADKVAGRCVYASTPFRGLDQIPALWPKVLSHRPDATLRVCSSMATYQRNEQDAQYQALFERVAALPGVTMRGALAQDDLYKEYAQAEAFYYPCTWPETYCLALDEATAHGCRAATTGLAALGERVGKADMARPFDAPFARAPIDWNDVARQWEALI